MTRDDGLDVVLAWLVEDAENLVRQARADTDATRVTEAGIERVRERFIELYDEVGIDISAEVSDSHDLPTRAMPPAASHVNAGLAEWPDLRAAAATNLTARGIDPASVDLDHLLDPTEVRRIERRFAPSFRVRAHLDQWDVCMTVIAGLVAALVDFLVVKIPKDVVYLGTYDQHGSALTGLLRDASVRHDNWMSDWAKVSYDHVNTQVTGMVVDGIGPRTHRLFTFGHDPLLGLVVGTIDIMRGGMTAVDQYGVLHVSQSFAPLEFNPFVALAQQMVHILSDAFTQMGVPVPGWALLEFAQFGSFGAKDRTVAEIAKWMYLQGYDSRHFLTMATEVAALEACLRTYWLVRRALDPAFAAGIEHEGRIALADHIGDHPRFQAMAFGAYAIAAAANAGKIAVYHGNPLAINYATWLGFLRAAFKFAQGRAVSPTDVLTRTSLANAEALSHGWPKLDRASDELPHI